MTRTEASSSKNDFDRHFLSFAIKKNITLAPTNRFQLDRKKKKPSSPEIIIIDDDDEETSRAASNDVIIIDDDGDVEMASDDGKNSTKDLSPASQYVSARLQYFSDDPLLFQPFSKTSYQPSHPLAVCDHLSIPVHLPLHPLPHHANHLHEIGTSNSSPIQQSRFGRLWRDSSKPRSQATSARRCRCILS